MALNCDSPDLHLLSNWDHRCASPHLANIVDINTMVNIYKTLQTFVS
jgi:hypothetical protein